VSALLWALLLVLPPPAAPSLPAVAAPSAVAAAPSAPSLLAPPPPRDLTRLAFVVRPFLGLTGNSWGQLGEARIEHYFRLPFMLGVELAPAALVSGSEGLGAATHARLVGAYVGEYLAVGLGVGARLQRFGTRGLSIAPSLRLGSLDGLSFSFTYSQTVAPNMYTGKPTVGLSGALGTLYVPFARRVGLELAGGFSLANWAYATIGLRQRLTGDGGPGTWILSAGLGAAYIVDRPPCDFTSDVVCGGASATSFGPTISIGLDRRF